MTALTVAGNGSDSAQLLNDPVRNAVPDQLAAENVARAFAREPDHRQCRLQVRKGDFAEIAVAIECGINRGEAQRLRCLACDAEHGGADPTQPPAGYVPFCFNHRPYHDIRAYQVAQRARACERLRQPVSVCRRATFAAVATWRSSR